MRGTPPPPLAICPLLNYPLQSRISFQCPAGIYFLAVCTHWLLFYILSHSSLGKCSSPQWEIVPNPPHWRSFWHGPPCHTAPRPSCQLGHAALGTSPVGKKLNRGLQLSRSNEDKNPLNMGEVVTWTIWTTQLTWGMVVVSMNYHAPLLEQLLKKLMM